MGFILNFALVFTILSTTLCLAEERPITSIKNGKIRGVYRTSTNGRKYSAFEGVPYAEPPIGNLRFKESISKKPWSGIWDAKTVHQCMQINHEPQDLGIVEGAEDCLYVNVYTPHTAKDAAKNNLFEVIVHFHSGAFMWGRGDIYGAKHLMDQDVVYINLNYRLGPLGFLSLGDQVLPGNNGLKDQVLALEWVRDNIKHFGGNPNSVTITGLSAGGASTHYHFLSPLSQGLFQRGISVSGTALDNWALTENAVEKTRHLGYLVGCEQKNSGDFVNCLRERSPVQIIQMVKKFQPWLYNPYSPFGPVVERHGGRKFLTDVPYRLISKGLVADVPWLTSVTSEDGLYPAAQFVYNETWLPELEENWEKIAPYILHYDTTVSKEERDIVSKKIKDYYFKGEPISLSTYPELVQAVGDRLFVVDSEKAAKIQAKVNKSPVYYYYFSYRGDHSYSEYFTGTQENFGVCHADDLMYIMHPDPSWFKTYMKNDDDKKMSKILTEIWMSFIKNNKPSISGVVDTWTPVSKNSNDLLNYVHIASPDSITQKTIDTLGNGEFWNSLPLQENEKYNMKAVDNKNDEL